MKNITWLLFISAMWVLPVSAQSVFLTPRAGLNLSTITQAEATMKSGLNFGVSGEYAAPMSPLAAVVGLFYSMQGCNIKENAVHPEHNYLNLPVLFKYYLESGTEWDKRGLSIFAGPQFDLKAVANKVSYAKGEYSGILLSDDMSKTFGMSAVIGAEYLFDVGLVLSANVNIGLTDKAKEYFFNYGSRIPSNGPYKDLVIQINFGYRFSIL